MIGTPLDQLHHEVGTAGFGCAGVEHPGDVGVVHHGQGLALGLEPGDDLFRVHPRLDDLQSHLAAHGALLLGHVDDAHAPLADLLQQLVRADDRAGAFHRLGLAESQGRARGGRVQEAAHSGLGVEQPLDPPPQLQVRRADLIEVGGPGLGRLSLQRSKEDLVDVGRRTAHGRHSSQGAKHDVLYKTVRNGRSGCLITSEFFFKVTTQGSAKQLGGERLSERICRKRTETRRL